VSSFLGILLYCTKIIANFSLTVGRSQCRDNTLYHTQLGDFEVGTAIALMVTVCISSFELQKGILHIIHVRWCFARGCVNASGLIFSLDVGCS